MPGPLHRHRAHRRRRCCAMRAGGAVEEVAVLIEQQRAAGRNQERRDLQRPPASVARPRRDGQGDPARPRLPLRMRAAGATVLGRTHTRSQRSAVSGAGCVVAEDPDGNVGRAFPQVQHGAMTSLPRFWPKTIATLASPLPASFSSERSPVGVSPVSYRAARPLPPARARRERLRGRRAPPARRIGRRSR